MVCNKPLSKESEDDLLSQTSVDADSKLKFTVTKKDMTDYKKETKVVDSRRQLQADEEDTGFIQIYLIKFNFDETVMNQ